MSTKSDIEKQLEETLGADAMQFIEITQAVATSTESNGLIIRQHILNVDRPNQCSFFPRLLDVAGFNSTGSDGKRLFRLTDFLCPAGERFIQPINVVATPLSSRPVFLTVEQSLLNNGANVEIKVSTWDAGGAAAPNISFNWRCRVTLEFIP